jgi:hypothetical protein
MLISFIRKDGHKITIPEKSLLLIEEDPTNTDVVFIQYYDGSYNRGEHVSAASLGFLEGSKV